MKNVRLLTKPQYHEEDSEGTWALSYGDMITLLLSFFVIFFTTDPLAEKTKKVNSLLSFELESAREITPETSAGKGFGKVTLSDIPRIAGSHISAHEVEENIVVTFGATSFFSSGEVKPNKAGEALLAEFTEKYLPYAGNYKLSIKGFTDSRPVSKRKGRKYDDNLELSALRSLAAMRVLQRAGIPLNSMEIAGAGELAAIDRVLPRAEALTKSELEAFSRTIVLVISPAQESFL